MQLCREKDRKTDLVELDPRPEGTPIGEAILAPSAIRSLRSHQIGDYTPCIVDLTDGEESKTGLDGIPRQTT